MIMDISKIYVPVWKKIWWQNLALLSETQNAVFMVMQYCKKKYYKTESSGSSSSKIHTGIKSELLLV